ncbi:MAG: sugar ABC transporter permease [Bacillota bacterium]|jgi:multiple sugar transport system permease protein|nr:sugar ABC transporter permease [Bacillota bacterium]
MSLINKKKIKSSLKAYLFLAPFLVAFGSMIVYPIGLGIKLSMYGQRGARMWYVGFENYTRIFNDPLFWESFKVPLFLLLVQVPVMLALGVMIAFMFETRKRSGAFYRLLYYLPYTIPGIVAGLVWSYIFSDSMSPLGPLFSLFGYTGKILTRGSVPSILLVIILWQFTGYTAFILYSSLIAIPREYAEAAQIDGAANWQIALRVKLPLLRDPLITLFIFNAIGAMQVFNEPRMLGDLVVLPPYYTPTMYIYSSAFSQGRFTYAAAMGIILAVLTCIISLYMLRTASKQILDRQH